MRLNSIICRGKFSVFTDNGKRINVSHVEREQEAYNAGSELQEQRAGQIVWILETQGDGQHKLHIFGKDSILNSWPVADEFTTFSGEGTNIHASGFVNLQQAQNEANYTISDGVKPAWILDLSGGMPQVILVAGKIPSGS